ncbi:MAG: hypothetical protein Q4A74_05065 [Cardiobacteriaceae bacterium]|nr:hypothetical protein [Cardiobacteriaceae bacterium]
MLLIFSTLTACTNLEKRETTLDTYQSMEINCSNAAHITRTGTEAEQKKLTQAIAQAKTPDDWRAILSSKRLYSEKIKQMPTMPVMSSKELGFDRDGEVTLQSNYGRYAKTVIRNSIVDDYFDIYEADGKLQSHTPLIKGIAQGWPDGYTVIHSRLYYKDGKVTRWQAYTLDGQLIDEDIITP